MATPSAEQPQQPTNWFTDWQHRTPVVSRYMAYITIPVSLISAFAGGALYTSNIPAMTLGRGEVWRVFTSMLDQGGFFTVLFVALVLLFQAPAHEYRVGSTLFLYQTFLQALLINVGYAIIGIILGSIPDGFFRMFGQMPSQGLWGVIMAQITVQVLSDPTGSTNFLCCPPILNRYYPWFLVVLFSLLSFFPQVDLLLGVIIGHLVSYGHMKRLDPSTRKLQDWETSGWAARMRMSAAPGFVYAPTTVLPVGQRDVARERMAGTWGMVSQNMFGPQGGQQGQAQAATGSSGGAAQAGGGSGEGEGEEGGRSFMVRPGRLGVARNPAASPTTFPGGGRPLGSTDGPSSSTGAPAGSTGPAGGFLGGIMGRMGGGGGAGGSATTTITSGGASAGGGAGPSAADIAERRRAAAAAAEARLRASAARGFQPESPRATGNGSASGARAGVGGTSAGGGSGQTTDDLLGITQGSATPSTPAKDATTATAAPMSGYARAVAASRRDPTSVLSGLGGGNGGRRGVGAGEEEHVPLVSAAGGSHYPDEDVDLDIGSGLRSTGTAVGAQHTYVPAGGSASSSSGAPPTTVGGPLARLVAKGIPLPELNARVRLLTDMGFAHEAAVQALLKTGGDVDAAAEHLATI